MNFWQKIIGSFRRSANLTDATGWRGIPLASYSGSQVTHDSALGLPTVWGCTNLIAGTGASFPLMVYRPDRKGDRQVARDHPLFYLLHDSPNADQTAMDFWEFVFASVELRGDAFAEIERASTGRIIALTPIRPDLVTPSRQPDGSIGYRWTDGGASRFAGQANMLHVRGFGGSPLGGLSTLAFARNTFGLAQDIEHAAAKTFVNGLRPSGALVFPDWLSTEQRIIAREELISQFAGSENAGQPMVLEGSTTWQSFSIKPEDAQMLQSRAFSVEDICRFFGVPPIMVGHGEKTSSWGTGIVEVTQGFVKFTMRRRLKRIEQALMKQLLTPADRAAGVIIEFNIEGLLRGDSAARSAFYTAALAAGWMTINEVRALENLPSVPGGDTPRMQMQNVPIAEAGVGHNGGPALGDD